MKSQDGLVFKLACTPDEMQQIRDLNYETFVEEIHQHEAREERALVDRFDEENTYFIGLDEGRLVGMMALRGRRPFSLDAKLEDLNSHLPPHRSPCEIRLLAVRPEYRHHRVAARLLALLYKVNEQRRHDLAVISATTGQLRLYRHMGFQPFGPLVGTEEAPFQPMYLTLERFRETMEALVGKVSPELFHPPLNLLPGPVEIPPLVQKAMAAPAISHRSAEFKAMMRATKGMLKSLTGASGVEIAPGSGTLACDMVGTQLAARLGPGLILSNGEFGDRLLDHAARFGLDHHVHSVPWGDPFDYDAVEAALSLMTDPRWVWCVHGETSTGVLNDLPRLKQICRAREIDLYVDVVSTLGVVPLDLRGVKLAAAVSGKALGAYPGLALVFHDALVPTPRAPRSLDLHAFAAKEGIPYTIGSNLVNALRAALERLDVERRWEEGRVVSEWLRERLGEMGLRVLAPPACAFHAVSTIPLPPSLTSLEVGQALVEGGFWVSFESAYLVDRNWIQVCLMRDSSIELLEPLVEALAGIVMSAPRVVGVPGG